MKFFHFLFCTYSEWIAAGFKLEGHQVYFRYCIYCESVNKNCQMELR